MHDGPEQKNTSTNCLNHDDLDLDFLNGIESYQSLLGEDKPLSVNPLPQSESRSLYFNKNIENNDLCATPSVFVPHLKTEPPIKKVNARDKVALRREQNRLSAQNSRARKKAELETLSQLVKTLTQEKQALQEENENLKAQNNQLTLQLWNSLQNPARVPHVSQLPQITSITTHESFATRESVVNFKI